MARKKTKRRDDEDDDLPDEPSSVDEAPRKPKAKDDAWTGLLAISLVALIGATVLFYLDHEALSAQQVAPPTFTLPGLGAAAPAPAAG